MVFQCMNIRQVPWEVLKTAASGLSFQHLPRDLANVNAWKTMLDPYIVALIRTGLQRSLLHMRVYLRHVSLNIRKRIFRYVPASVAQLDAPSDWRPGGRGFHPRRGRQHSFMEIDHEIFSTVILSPFRWFKKGSCQFLAKECAQYWLTA